MTKTLTPEQVVARSHPAANIYPIDDDSLQSLADDIKKHGQLVPVELIGDRIIDGRRRTLACHMAGVKPETKQVFPPDPYAYVLSLNSERRHLTPAQRAMAAARARDWYDEQAKERQRERVGQQPGATVQEHVPELSTKGQSRDLAGKTFNVSGRSVDAATRIIKRGSPELVKATDAGKLSLRQASAIASEPAKAQPALVKSTIENPRRVPKSVPPGQGTTGDGQVGRKEKPRPKRELLPGEHNMTELYADNTADVAITQLKRIPEKNAFRMAAMDKVVSWIESQR